MSERELNGAVLMPYAGDVEIARIVATTEDGRVIAQTRSGYKKVEAEPNSWPTVNGFFRERELSFFEWMTGVIPTWEFVAE